MKKYKLILLTLLSAILFPLALPNEVFPSGSALLVLISISPLYLALYFSPGIKISALLGIIFGAVSTIFANYWLMYFGEFSFWTLGGVTLGYMGYNALLAPYLWHFLREKRFTRPLLFAAAWALYEYLKSIGYLGYPWGLIAYPMSNVIPLIQQVDFAGVWLISFKNILVNALIAETFISFFEKGTRGVLKLNQPLGSRDKKRPMQPGLLLKYWLFYLLIFSAGLGYGMIRLRHDFQSSEKVNLSLIQQNSDSWIRGNTEETLYTAQELSHKAVSENPDTDMVIWSETSLPWPPFKEGKDFWEDFPPNSPMVGFIRSLDTYFLTGGITLKNGQQEHAMNSAVLISEDAKLLASYGKQHPVPFAENVPFWEIPAVKRFFQNVVGLPAIWTMGNEYRIFSIEYKEGRQLKFGTPICFEDAFAYLCRRFVLNGADALINLTNNSWSKTESAQIQHFVAARFRAVENRKPLIRSTNSGLTAVVDPHGRLMTRLPMFEEGYLNVEVPVYENTEITVYTRFGDYLPIAFAALLFLMIIRWRLKE